jgi:hypothetical protein
MPRRAGTATVFALALALLSLGLAGCGAAERQTEADPSMRRASEQTLREGTARFEMRYVAREDADDLEGTCEGAASYTDRRFRAVCTHRIRGGRAHEIEVVSVGGVDYVRYEGDELPLTDPDKPWVRLDLDEGEEDLFSVFDPVALLEMLRSASRKTEHEGDDLVRGVPTEHFRLTVDRKKAELLAEDDEGPETVPVDVWIDADSVVRRIRSEEPPDTTWTMEFYDFGAAVQIEAPPQDRVGEIDERDEEYARPAPCPGGATAPLTEETVTTILGDHGIELARMPSGCGGPGEIVISLTNVHADPPRDEPEAQDDVLPAEGLVVCVLRRRALGGAGTTLRKENEHGVTTFELANLECSLYRPDDPADDEFGLLEKGLREVERTLR